MCRIAAYVGDGNALGGLLTGLENRAYRGYDSAGIAVRDGRRLQIVKCEGELAELRDALGGQRLPGPVGIPPAN